MRKRKTSASETQFSARSRARSDREHARKPAKKPGDSASARARSAGESARKSTQQNGESPEPILPPWSPSTGGAGRPSLYTPTLHATICALIAAGTPVRTAARQQRIGARTLYDWRDKGLAGVEPYVAFAADLDAAIAYAETSVVTTIVATTRADWKAGAWWLERRFPKRYGSKQHMRIEKTPPEMTDAELEEAIAAHGYVRTFPPTDDTPQGT